MDPWLHAMRRGDFESAWQVCDHVLEHRQRERIDCGHRPRHERFVWDGGPLEGRDVLVHCYHGLGDTLQFVRLLPALRARARRTTLWVQPALVELLRGCAGIDRLLPLHDGAAPAGHEAHVELMELPHALRLDPRALPGPVPYVHVPCPGRRPADDPCLRVGLAWRAGAWNPERSIPSPLLAPLAGVAGVRWHALQWRETPPSFALDHACGSLVQQARRMQSLDLVVSVDTMTAHLAGALGLPTWTLLPPDPDWRWPTSGATSPWYPTMRLFHRRVADGWSAVIAAVAAALAERGEEFTQSRRDTA